MSSSVTADERADGRVDVARDAEIDDQQGRRTPAKSAACSTWDSAATAVSTTSASASSPATRSSGAARISKGRADGLADELARPLLRAVDHHHARGASAAGDVAQRAADAEAHFARPHHDHPRAAQPGLVLATGHRDGGVGEGGRPLADPGLGPHPLAGLERVAEEGGEHRAAGPLLLGALEGPPDLAHHLGLARDDGLEARGDGEEVGGDVVVEADDRVLGELLDRKAGVLGEDVVDLGHGVVEAVDDGVDLGAQAGREHHRFLDVAAVAQRAERPCAGRRRPMAAASRSGSGAWVCWSPTTTTDTRFLSGQARVGTVRAGPGGRMCQSRPPACQFGARVRRGGPSSAQLRARREPDGAHERGPAGPPFGAGPLGLLLAGPVEAEHLQLDGEVDVAQVDRRRAPCSTGARSSGAR